MEILMRELRSSGGPCDCKLAFWAFMRALLAVVIADAIIIASPTESSS